MNDLWQQICEVTSLLDKALKLSGKRGHEMVICEAEYYTAKAKEVFDLREQGMPATLINSVVKGQPAVVEKMKAYHAAQVAYENACEARNVYKKKLDTLREQYEREWSRSGMT